MTQVLIVLLMLSPYSSLFYGFCHIWRDTSVILKSVVDISIPEKYHVMCKDDKLSYTWWYVLESHNLGKTKYWVVSLSTEEGACWEIMSYAMQLNIVIRIDQGVIATRQLLIVPHSCSFNDAPLVVHHVVTRFSLADLLCEI